MSNRQWQYRTYDTTEVEALLHNLSDPPRQAGALVELANWARSRINLSTNKRLKDALIRASRTFGDKSIDQVLVERLPTAILLAWADLQSKLKQNEQLQDKHLQKLVNRITWHLI